MVKWQSWSMIQKGEKVRIELKRIQAGLVLAVTAMVILASASWIYSPSLGSAADRDPPPAVGEKVADFSLTSVDGKQLTLSDELKRGPRRSGPLVRQLFRSMSNHTAP
jgi:hypothetical protein